MGSEIKRRDPQDINTKQINNWFNILMQHVEHVTRSRHCSHGKLTKK